MVVVVALLMVAMVFVILIEIGNSDGDDSNVMVV